MFIVGPSVLYDPITVNNESLTDSLDKTYYYIVEEHESFLYEGRADNEAPNSDNDDYEDPDFADGDLNEVNKIITVCDYNYIPEVSTWPFVPIPQPEVEGIIYVGGPPQNEEGS